MIGNESVVFSDVEFVDVILSVVEFVDVIPSVDGVKKRISKRGVLKIY